MSTPNLAFRRRLTGLIASIALAVLAGVALAMLVQRDASRSLRKLAGVELEAALLTRQFRAAVDDLHGALLRIGTDAAEDSAVVIEQRRHKLSEWLAARQAAAHSDNEKLILERLAAEIRSYFLKLDGLFASPGGAVAPLNREAVLMFDDSANRLQGMADDFAAVHDQDLRQLLEDSLASVRWMRNLVFVCLVLLVSALGILVALVYRDVVRPLREQLVESKSLLVKREKLAALGTLAAGVAHEIRNPLTAIKARLYTLRRTLSREESQEDVHAITLEADRLERIVRDVLGYAHPAEPALSQVELAAWLREFAAFVEPGIASRQIELVIEAPTAVVVHIDANQLRQIMLNLVRNAEEALEGRPGRITLALHRERAPLRGRTIAVAVLAVTDTGPGIPAEIQARLFDPFFTTKAAGTGLGLSIVARLVENQGGEISFQSAPRTGTRFAVRLPVADPLAQSLPR